MPLNAAQIFLFNGTSFVLLSSIVLKAFTKNRFGLVTNERVFRCQPSVTRIFTNFVYGSQSFMKGTVERSSNFPFQRYKFRSLSSIVLKAFTKNRFGLVTNERVFRCQPSVTRIFTNFVYGSQSFMKGAVERSSNFPFQRYKFRSLIFYSFESVYEKPFRSCNKRTRFQMPTVCHPNFYEFFLRITELQ